LATSLFALMYLKLIMSEILIFSLSRSMDVSSLACFVLGS
jgi:hypothetical protein